MKVVSVNIGEKKAVSWKGKTVETGIFKSPIQAPIYLGKSDVKGDVVVDRKYHGGAEMACFIYSADHYPFWKEKYPDLKWEHGMFGENITLSGLNEADLMLGDEFQLGTAKVRISQPRKPCFKLGIRFETQAVLKDYIKAPYPGVYLSVVEEGDVNIGDKMTLLQRHSKEISLLEVYQLFYQATAANKVRIQEILKEDFISKDIRSGLEKSLSAL